MMIKNKEERIEIIATHLAKNEESLNNIRWILHQLKDDDIEYLYKETNPYKKLIEEYQIKEAKKDGEICF